MLLTNLIGTLAGVLTTIAFVPQVIKTWRTRSARDISLGMFVLFTMGVLLWFIYGLLIQAMPVILANGITLVLSGLILFMKIKEQRAERRRMLAASQRGL